MTKKPVKAKTSAPKRAKAKKTAPVQAASKPKPLTTAQRLDAIGIEAICIRIESGEDDGTIATGLGMDRMSLRQWIKARDYEEVIRSAREESAEAWLDRGLNVVASALRKTGGIDAGAARAYAQECARRASIRNSKYRDKVALGGDAENPLKCDVNLSVSFVKP